MAQCFDGANFSPKMWRGGAKIKWRSAAVALMLWLENFSRALVLYIVFRLVLVSFHLVSLLVCFVLHGFASD